MPTVPTSRPSAPAGSPARDRELLDATLDVLAETGYDRLTVDAVAARAHASKATLYRRWPSKADLVVAAFGHAVGHPGTAPDTGSLRGDLLAVVEQVTDEMSRLGELVVALLQEVRRNPELARAFTEQFLAPRRAGVRTVFARARARGELDAAADGDLAWDVAVGLLLYRAAIPAPDTAVHPPRRFVDEILLPILAGHPRGSLASGA